MLDDPNHPYALAGIETIQNGLVCFQELCKQAGYPMNGSLEKNWLLPTTLGTLRPTCLLPETMLAGDLSSKAPLLLVGFKGYPDFYPHLLANNLSIQGYTAEAVLLDLPELRERKFVTSMILAGLFEDAGFREAAARAIKSRLGGWDAWDCQPFWAFQIL